MAPEQKADLVCAFHGDLEKGLERIETKLDAIQKQLDGLSLWRAKVMGYAAGVAAAVTVAMKYILR
jgi:hypothetical protein